MTLYFHPWQYSVRGWLYHDIIFSLLTIFGQGVLISWHYIFTPGNIWWGDEYIVTLYFHSQQYLEGRLYIVTLYFHSWQYLVRGWIIVTLYFHSWQYLMRGWLYRDIIFSPLTIFGQGVIISWHYNIISDTTLESGTGGDFIWIFSLSKFDSAVIPGFYYSYPYIHPMKLGGLKWLYLSMIPSLLLKLSVVVDMLMDCINSLWWTKICKKS